MILNHVVEGSFKMVVCERFLLTIKNNTNRLQTFSDGVIAIISQ